MSEVLQQIETHHNVDDLTPYQRFQLETFGNILPAINDTPDEEVYEVGLETSNRLSAYMEHKMDDHWGY